MKHLLKGMMPAYGWLLFVTVLLLLPGSALPSEPWMSEIPFDKLAHIFFFAVLVWLFCRGYYQSRQSKKVLGLFIFIAINVVLYGIAMEFIQKYFIPYRSFDNGDIIADAIGAAIGFFAAWMFYARAKPN